MRVKSLIGLAIAVLVLVMLPPAQARSQDLPAPTCAPGPESAELIGYRLRGIRQPSTSELFGSRTVLRGIAPESVPLRPVVPTPIASPTPTPTPLPICTPTPTPTPTSIPTASANESAGVPPVATTSTPTTVPTPDAEVAAPANVGRLARFVETTTGRSFPFGAPPIKFIQPNQVGPSTDEELVPLDLWDLLQVSGLVDLEASRSDAAEAWGETGRGVCCPVVVVDGHDRASNEIIIVHELTHALDYPMFRWPSYREVVSPERAIVEGNAHRVAYLYAETLIAAGAEVQAAPALFPEGTDPRMPHALQELFEYPYDEGKVFAEAVADRGGEEAVVDVFARPPIAAEVLDPSKWFQDIDWPIVATPSHLILDPATDSGQLGAFFLRLMLRQSTSSIEAERLSNTWLGDAYALTQHEQRRCIGITFEVSGDESAEAIASIIGAENATVEAIGSRVEFSRCVYQLDDS